MHTMLKLFVISTICCVGVMGGPSRLPFVSASADAAQLICTSTSYQYSYCGAGVKGARVAIVEQLSRAPCQQGRSWGYDERGIWVNNGCAARFSYNNGNNGGDALGAAIVGGVIGALLGGAGSDHHSHSTYNYYDHSDPYFRPYPVTVEHHVVVERHRDTSQDTDNSVRKFDKDGNPNYDTNGNYQGAHGVGALVDNPDASSSEGPENNPSAGDDPN